jgi:hypothetical protein
MEKFAIHETRTYFLYADTEEEAMDKFLDGEYADKSDCDFEIEPWKD